jgi:hypothetical protein
MDKKDNNQPIIPVEDIEIIKNKLAKNGYTISNNFINQQTINLIIESEDQDKKIEDLKKLIELDLYYKKENSNIENTAIKENPVYIIDYKNEQNKRMLNYLLWVTGTAGIVGILNANIIGAFFIGVSIILALLTVSFNTRVTTSDRRMLATVVSKLIDSKDKLTNENENKNIKRRK